LLACAQPLLAPQQRKAARCRKASITHTIAIGTLPAMPCRTGLSGSTT
jgi:hypothetical protein